MKNQSMTAVISAFARAYHSENNQVKIFDDTVARRLFTDAEYREIQGHLKQGIDFFMPNFQGSEDDAVRLIVNNQLSPSPLGRAAFCESNLKNSSCNQYLILAAGYDTFAYRQPQWAAKMQIFEIDHPATAADKQQRLIDRQITIPANVTYVAADFNDNNWIQKLLQNKEFDKTKKSFGSLLGISYYLPQAVFQNLLNTIGSILPKDSIIIFDYPLTATKTGQSAKQEALAAAADEPMQTTYSVVGIEGMLKNAGFAIMQNLQPKDITAIYFAEYNRNNPDHPITAFDNVCYCSAVKI